MSDNIETKQAQAEQASAAAQGTKKRHIALYIVIAVIAVLLILAGVGYFLVADYYKNHFLPGTTLNQIVCDNLEASEVAVQLEAQSQDYSLTVLDRNGEVIGTLAAEDVGMKTVGALDVVEEILAGQEYRNWLMPYFGKKEYRHDVVCAREFDKEKTLKKLEEWEALDAEQMDMPQDAYISEYMPEKKAYEIIPETEGNALDVEKVNQLVLAAVENGEAQLDLGEYNCYYQAVVTAQDKTLNKTVQELNKVLGTQITYDWNGSEVILDVETIHEWILPPEEDDISGDNGQNTLDADKQNASDSSKQNTSDTNNENTAGNDAENDTRIELAGGYSLDTEAIADFVAAQAKTYDTYGKHRQFTTTLGETIKVLNGGYGWKTDREQETEELTALILEGAVTKREPVYKVKAAKKGEDDIGNSYVEIDLTNQHLYVYWKGEIVLETDFVSGNMSNGNVTPGGLYRLTYKTTDAVLRGADYVTPVKYWMPFNGNIGMHDATWRNEFGGDIYLTNGSHGCVNLPLDKAEAIYGYVSTGFPIICYYY